MDYELLAPAGNKDSFLAAIAEGADAVYLGLNAFSARSSAENFSVDELPALLDYAHFLGIKVYVALNTIVKEDELPAYMELAGKAVSMGADALIVQDIFLGKLIKDNYPEAVTHLSTQGGVNNVYGALVAKDYGFTRVILARETPIEEIRKIAAVIETEVFVQGALCTSFSGQCYMSSFIGGQSGNRGRCKQPCRKEYTLGGEKKYAISLSDLCVGSKIEELKKAGVTSFKIEGRMRRTEYVAAAVKYYRGILSGTGAPDDISDLKRTYNRGNYTTGLAFGQTKGFISHEVQGHIGEHVGTIISINGNRITVKGSLNANKGDGFKILRNGQEVGSAVAEEASGDGNKFTLYTRDKLLKGDEVRITTDVELQKELASHRVTRPVSVTFSARVNEVATATAEYNEHKVTLSTATPLPPATGRALTMADVEDIFRKVDNYPYSPAVDVDIKGDLFAPRSILNALRRELYAKLMHPFTRATEYKGFSLPGPAPAATTNQSIVIAEDFSFAPKAPPFAAVFAPEDYNDVNSFEKFFRDTEGRSRYLYLPAFLTEADEEIIAARISGFDGIYGENIAAIKLADKYGVRLLAGSGFNLFNSVDLSGISAITNEFILSKELSVKEAKRLGNGTVFARGDIKVMDLIYCPYGKACAECKGKHFDTLTDYAGRKFTLRRYKLSSCRFEVYNPQILLARFSGGALYNLICCRKSEDALARLTATDAELRALSDTTQGNSRRGVL